MSWYQRPPKRIPGDGITCIKDLVRWLDAGGYVFFNHKAYHPKVIHNWSLGRLQQLCRFGGLPRAVLNPKRYDISEFEREREKRMLSFLKERKEWEGFVDANGTRLLSP